MKNKIVLLAALFVICFSSAQVALAQYGQYEGPANDALQQKKDLAKKAVEIASQHPGQGSGTPFLDVTGVVGSSIIIGSVFGGITTGFIVKSRRARH